MKKIIDGKKYDTDTAREVASWDTGNPTDFGYIEETLYRKKTGEYFVHGYGAAASCYAEPADNGNWKGGSAITPLDYAHARNWMEMHADADGYEAEFGEVADDGTKVAKTVYLTASTSERIARAAAERGCSQGDVIEQLAAEL